MASGWIKVDSARNVGEASVLGAALEAHGIEMAVRGEHLPAIAGELPLPEAQVELWVPAEHAERARQILAEAREPSAEPPPHRCPHCGEENPGNFARCWKCEQPLLDGET